MWQEAAELDATFTGKLEGLNTALRLVAEAETRRIFPPYVRGRFNRFAEEAAYFHDYLSAAGVSTEASAPAADTKSSTPPPAPAESAAAADPKSPSSAEKTTGAERIRDERGVPVIPGLADAGVILFDDLWSQAQESPMDDAVSRLEGVLDLIQHHPALAPEVAHLRRLCATWWALVPSEDTCRFASFELSLETARGLKMPEVMPHMMKFAKDHLDRPELAREREQLATINMTWELLNESPVLERSRKL